jgi:hypothetical protein|tara:strand:+ start:457 stop:663 length:207 start_codon:yes stop_codon:yes gene_type:complete
MPYHVKTPKAIGTGDVYWKENNTWTETYADRKQYANISDANAVKATTVTSNGITYAPKWFANSTVVTE